MYCKLLSCTRQKHENTKRPSSLLSLPYPLCKPASQQDNQLSFPNVSGRDPFFPSLGPPATFCLAPLQSRLYSKAKIIVISNNITYLHNILGCFSATLGIKPRLLDVALGALAELLCLPAFLPSPDLKMAASSPHAALGANVTSSKTLSVTPLAKAALLLAHSNPKSLFYVFSEPIYAWSHLGTVFLFAV